MTFMNVCKCILLAKLSIRPLIEENLYRSFLSQKVRMKDEDYHLRHDK